MCRDCAVSLTVHKPAAAADAVPLLRPGRARPPPVPRRAAPTTCARSGAGTQRVEDEIAEVFPDARVLRMDLDTTSRRGAHRRILDAFGRGDADILLGTQMVAKGLDFPRVTLVGVVEADTGMLLPDFRAAERTFQLLAQVAGRAGRHELPGEVLLQTRNPEHPAITFALEPRLPRVRPRRAGRAARARLPALRAPRRGRVQGAARGLDAPARRALGGRARRRGGPGRGRRGVGAGPGARSAASRRGGATTILVKAPRGLPASVLAAVVLAAQGAVRMPSGHRVNLDVDPVGLY